MSALTCPPVARGWDELFLTGDVATASRTAAAEEGEDQSGFFRRLRQNMRKTREALTAELQATLFQTLDDEAWERLEETLIYADVGAATTSRIVGRLEQEVEGGELQPGEPFEARLRELRGYPVVVNKWAAWCGPCQLEFPHFQQQATKRGREIAFLGVDSDDNRAEAATFLRDTPVPFPSYEDPDSRIADKFARAGFPTTVFIDERGRTAFIHQGQYRSEADLAADIDRYLRP